MDDLNFKEILVRKPFWEPVPSLGITLKTTNRADTTEPSDPITWRAVTQAEILRQFYPSSHAINDRTLYPDVYKKDPKTGKYYIQPVTRCAFAFQQVIKTKQVIHLTGNDVQFELAEMVNDRGTEASQDEANTTILNSFKKGWIWMSMEKHVFDFVDSFKTVGDAAMVFYFGKDRKPGCRVLSYINDDRLYPHFDGLTGELDIFARQYYDYDEEGKARTEWVEVWDEKYLYRAKRGKGHGLMDLIKDTFGISGYEMVSKEPHGFNRIPVVYYRDETGACWSAAQDTIEKYEEAYSYFFENNKAFAFPTMVLKGEGIEIMGDENGAVKSIVIDDPDGDAHYLANNDVSASYNTLLSDLYNLIYEQAFAVKPPELKSGDLPGVALKLLYSPAIERAIADCQRLQGPLDSMVELVKYCWGSYNADVNLNDILMLNINAWIEPYVHQNDTELVTNLNMAIQNGWLSKQTGSERIPKYAKTDEYSRIERETIDKTDLEVYKSNAVTEFQTDEAIRESKATAKNDDGSDINTGQGNKARKRGARVTDRWGNREGEKNWDRWNQTH